ncbi:MAG: hypothetical protein Q4F60_01840 [Candidatus Saccharibacteria bacterium]|nr:hypothetical protein [Candidatus Saccharibacteria bacterium]
MSTVPPETTDPIEPESVALENDTAQGDASVATSDASDLASRIPEV